MIYYSCPMSSEQGEIQFSFCSYCATISVLFRQSLSTHQEAACTAVPGTSSGAVHNCYVIIPTEYDLQGQGDPELRKYSDLMWRDLLTAIHET